MVGGGDGGVAVDVVVVVGVVVGDAAGVGEPEGVGDSSGASSGVALVARLRNKRPLLRNKRLRCTSNKEEAGGGVGGADAAPHICESSSPANKTNFNLLGSTPIHLTMNVLNKKSLLSEFCFH